jgi:hypothetical protein
MKLMGFGSGVLMLTRVALDLSYVVNARYLRACELEFSVTARGVPLIAARCNKPMARGGVCGMPPNHYGRCRTPEAVKKAYARNVEYRKRVALERHMWLNAYKLEHGCADCGYDQAAVALDFDHNDPTLKIANIAEMLHCTWRVIMAELEKCTVRCSNCHRIRTHRKPAIFDDDGLST